MFVFNFVRGNSLFFSLINFILIFGNDGLLEGSESRTFSLSPSDEKNRTSPPPDPKPPRASRDRILYRPNGGRLETPDDDNRLRRQTNNPYSPPLTGSTTSCDINFLDLWSSKRLKSTRSPPNCQNPPRFSSLVTVSKFLLGSLQVHGVSESHSLDREQRSLSSCHIGVPVCGRRYLTTLVLCRLVCRDRISVYFVGTLHLIDCIFLISSLDFRTTFYFLIKHIDM